MLAFIFEAGLNVTLFALIYLVSPVLLLMASLCIQDAWARRNRKK